MATEAQTAFFSYSRDDSEFALRLAADLKAAGANVWLDQLDLTPGELWDVGIQDALTSCPCVLLILSPASAVSRNVWDEFSFALNKQKTIIPVFYRDCEIPFRLDRLQYVDFRSDYAGGLRQLLHALGIAAARTPVSAVLNTPKPLYMAIADPELEFLQPNLDFDASFLLNFLFEDRLAITDAYLLTSNRLARHVLRSGRASLFEECLKDGIVVVKARDPGWTTIEQVLRPNYPGLVPEFGILRQKLVYTVGENARIEPWPSHKVGEQFELLVRQHLCQEEPSTVVLQSLDDPRPIQRLFRETLKLRLDGIPEAVRRTRADQQAGLQRWQYLQILREEVAPDSNGDTKIDRIKDVVQLTDDVEAKNRISQLWSIVCECYRYNQAKQFSTVATCPAYDVGLHLVAAEDVLTLRRNALLDGPIHATVAVPPLSALLAMDPKALLEVRNGEGVGYRASVSAWRVDPGNSTNRAAVLAYLKSYAAALLRWAQSDQKFRNTLLLVHLGKEPGEVLARFASDTKNPPASSVRGVQFLHNRTIDGYLWGPPTDIKIEVKPFERTPRPDLTLPDREPLRGDERL